MAPRTRSPRRRSPRADCRVARRAPRARARRTQALRHARPRLRRSRSWPPRAARARGERRHQRRVVGAAAADQDSASPAQRAAIGIGDGGAVNASSVACTSPPAPAPRAACRASLVSSQPALKRSRPVLFGGAREVGLGEQRVEQRVIDRARRAPRRRRDRRVAPRWRAHHRSSSTLPGPVSKPLTPRAVRGRKSVMLAMPPILTITRSRRHARTAPHETRAPAARPARLPRRRARESRQRPSRPSVRPRAPGC